MRDRVAREKITYADQMLEWIQNDLGRLTKRIEHLETTAKEIAPAIGQIERLYKRLASIEAILEQTAGHSIDEFCKSCGRVFIHPKKRKFRPANG